jgi:hypothetical protein
MKFNNWDDRQPDNIGKKEHCVEIWHTSRSWNDNHCLNSDYSLCQSGILSKNKFHRCI